MGGGWRRIVNINISAGDDCPGEWRKATQSFIELLMMISSHVLLPISLLMESATRGYDASNYFNIDFNFGDHSVTVITGQEKIIILKNMLNF